MIYYIIRRVLYTIPVWLGVIFITFVLFHMVNDPEDLAKQVLGKNARPETVNDWIRNHNYHLPLFIPYTESNLERYPENRDLPWYQTQFFISCRDLLLFEFGKSDITEKPINRQIRDKVLPSLAITGPSFILSLLVTLVLSLFIVLFRGTAFDLAFTFLSVVLLSVPILIYLMGVSYLNGLYLRYFPIFGSYYMPVFVSVISGIGGGVRFYRTVFLDQVSEDYVRTARAKGLSDTRALFVHVLPNSLIPILTSAVMQIPFLITGSLLLETFFGIPGLGDLFYKAILSSDFATIKAFTYLGAILYMVGLVLTDISYTLVDPRIVLR